MATKRCYFNGITRFAGLVLAITLLLPQLSHATAVGTTPGQFAVDPTGAATYTIPIEVPPGVAGLQPSLSLVYHSRSDNGLLGMGWSLSGLSAITRCPATIVQDGFAGGINFDVNDRFCLDGQRLVTNGTDTIPGYVAGAKYKTEIETFSKIVASGGTSSNPTYFIVKTKSGLLMEYGYQANARFYANGPNSTQYYAWALNKVQDRVGNSWNVTYTVDSGYGEYRPYYIYYQKAGSGSSFSRIEFYYEDRDDIETEYVAGSGFNITKRLTNIRTFAGPSSSLSAVRNYSIQYETNLSPSTYRSRLEKIYECGLDIEWVCKPETLFDWQSSGINFSASGQWLGPWGNVSSANLTGSSSKLMQGDFNGDGKMDLLWAFHDYPNSEYNVAISTGNGFTPAGKWLGPWGDANSSNLGFASSSKLMLGDFNGDGKTDLLWAFNDYPYSEYNVALSTGTSFIPSGKWLGPWGDANSANLSSPSSKLILGDFNGDGKTDLLWGVGDYPNSAYNVALSTGNSFEPSGQWLSAWGDVSSADIASGSSSKLMLSDFNGDGKTDLLWAFNDYPYSEYNVALSTGISFIPSGKWLGPWGDVNSANLGFASSSKLMLDDFNGDGKTDLLWGVGDYPNSAYNVALSTGSSFEPSGQWLSAWGNVSSANLTSGSSSKLMLSDFNGDGKTDLLWAFNDYPYSEYNVALSTGTGFISSGKWLGPWGDANSANLGFASSSKLMMGDYSGDGKTDLLWGIGDYPNSAYNVALAGGPFPDLLTTITNGLVSTTSLTYKPITDNTIYTKGADSGDDSPENHSTHPEYDYQGPMYVVTAVSSDNGIGGQNLTSYSYGGARIHREGRGFLGFRWMNVANVIDAQTINTKTYFKQDYPFAGQVDYAETILNGTTLKYVDNTWAVRASDNFVYLNESTEINRELNGSFISKTRSKYLDNSGDGVPYDTYGNPEKIEVATNTADDAVYEYVTTTTSTYNAADTTNWILGQLQRAEATNQIPGEAVSTARVSTFEYYGTGTWNGMLKAEIIEPDNTNLKLRTEYVYDAYGNRTSTTLSGNAGATYPITTRATSVLFSNVDAINPTTVTTNALSQTETKVFDARYGVPTSLTGPNGLVTSWDYDAFGRKILETRADTNTTTWAYAWCDASCPTNAVYKVTNTTSGSAPVTVFYDKLGREVQSQTTGFNSLAVYKDTEYDSVGRVNKVSSPYFSGATKYSTSFTYDVLGRVRTQTTPDNTVTESQYDGLHTTVYADLNGKNQRTEQWKNVLGQLIQVQDALLNSTYYVYDAYGNLDKVTDAAGNITNMDYDIRGNKTAMDDPDMGHWEYKYDALGLLRWQKNAKLQTTTMTYDTLNRLKTRVEPEGTSQWTYDTATGKGKGKIAQVTGPNSYKRVHVYDTLGREITVTTTISAVNYVVSYAYDSKSRIDTVTYPMGVSSRFAIRNIYDTNGYLKEVQNASNSSVYYWKAVGINAAGQVTWETAGNNLDTLNTYNPQTGRLEVISTASGSVQSLGFGYDSLGNLLTRTDSNQGLTESFTYDSLNRLDTAQIVGYGIKDYDYNAIGNIMSKSDYATTYVYGTKPHAVTSVKNGTTTVATYAYDSNGNMTSGAGRAIGYSSYNKPTTITQGTKYSNFQYGPDRTRTVQTSSSSSGTSTTIYINPGVDSGVYFEKETKGGVTSYTNYIYGGSGLIGTYTTRSNSTQSTRYFHKDHLGSIDVITNETGAVVERLSYDAFGQRRMALCGPTNPVCVAISAVTRHGFTNHEHLDEVSLIHMNGRVYDPKLGRFLSADPIMHALGNTQSLNRYSYVDNNPLKYTDPSGYKKFWKQRWFRAAIIAAVAVYIGGVAANAYIGSSSAASVSISTGISGTLQMAVVAGATSGAILGAYSGYKQTGNLEGTLRGAARGGVNGGISGGISYTANAGYGDKWTLGRVTKNTISQGLSSVVNDGEFRQGVNIGFITSTSAYAYQKLAQEGATLQTAEKLASKDGTYVEALGVPKGPVNVFGTNTSPLTGNAWDDLWKQGGPISNFMAGDIGGMSSVAKFHDYLQISFDKISDVIGLSGYDSNLRTVLNVPAMVPAAAINYAAILYSAPVNEVMVDAFY